MTNAKKLLLEVYRKMGPKEVVNSRFRPVPPREFAKMGRRDVDRWDGMPDRYFFQRIAKELAK